MVQRTQSNGIVVGHGGGGGGFKSGTAAWCSML